MAQISDESIFLETNRPDPTSGPTMERQERPLMKERRRLFKRLGSSPSLARLARTPSGSYRSGGKASVSCISLSSAASPYTSYGSPLSTELSVGYSTAPTSAVTTPGIHIATFDDKARLRHVNVDGQRSVPLPAELRPTSRRAATSAVAQERDYFSIPIRKPFPRRPNFNFWHDLPSELRVQILSYLKPKDVVRCSAVSKQWYKTCFDGQLWANLDTSEFYADIPADSLVKIITSAGPFVRDLNLRGCVQLEGQTWYPTSEACSNLENVSLEGCKIERKALHCLILQNNRLTTINMSGLGCATNATMKKIAECCPRLEQLNISWCNNVDTRGLREVVERCPSLRDIRAGEVRGWDDVEFMRVLFEKNSLERLILMNCDSLNDESLAVLMEGIDSEMDYLTGRPIVPPRRLKHLDLTRCRGISDTGIKTCIDNIPEMEGLQLSKCHGVNDETINALLSTMPNLTHLDLEELGELSNSVLTTLSASPCAKKLRHLSVSYCENLGDVGMLAVLKNCTQLRSLDMDNTRISDLCLAEAAAMVRARSPRTTCSSERPTIGLRMVAYDCQNVTWTGVRAVLSRNAEVVTTRLRPQPQHHNRRQSTDGAVSSGAADTEADAGPAHPMVIKTYPTEVIQLKCFYNYQPTVEEHAKRVLRGDFGAAHRLERKWAEFMIAQEEAGASGAGARRRRRRAREAQMMHADEEDSNGAGGGVGGGRRRRARSGGCAIM